MMQISSRTPEGIPTFCPVCGKFAHIEPSSFPLHDAPCPHCGHLLQFAVNSLGLEVEVQNRQAEFLQRLRSIPRTPSLPRLLLSPFFTALSALRKWMGRGSNPASAETSPLNNFSDAEEWYAAKTVYKHHRVEDSVPKTVYEERVVLFRATVFDHAIAQAEAEAAEYCDDGTVFLGFVDVFQLFEEKVGHGTEVYSLMRDSELPDQEYLSHFYDNGHEHSQTAD